MNCFLEEEKIEQIVPVQVSVLLYFLFFAWASYCLKMKAPGGGFLAKENLVTLTSCYVYKTCIDMKFFFMERGFSHFCNKWLEILSNCEFCFYLYCKHLSDLSRLTAITPLRGAYHKDWKGERRFSPNLCWYLSIPWALWIITYVKSKE